MIPIKPKLHEHRQLLVKLEVVEDHLSSAEESERDGASSLPSGVASNLHMALQALGRAQDKAEEGLEGIERQTMNQLEVS